MKETRRHKIENRIFKKSDLINIGKVFLKEYEISKEKENHSSISFRLDCVDNSSYESEDLGIFDKENIIDVKRTNSIEMSYYDYELNRSINFTLSNEKYSTNVLIVKGYEQNWVNGLFANVKELIDSTEPQNNWIINHKTLILHLSAFGIGIVIYSIFYFLIGQHIEPIKNPSETIINLRTFFGEYSIFGYVYYLLIRWGLGITWAILLRNWLLSLWPEIEFDFGPEHLKIERKRRIRISLFIFVGVIPIIVSVGSDLLKSLILLI